MIICNARCLIEWLSSKGWSLQTNMQNKIIGNPLRSKTQQGMIRCWDLIIIMGTISTIASLLFFLSPHCSSHSHSPTQVTATYLVNTVLVNSLLLVQSSQSSIVTLVQSPALRHRNPELVSLLQGQEKGLDGTLQARSVSSIKLQTLGLNESSALTSLLNT